MASVCAPVFGVPSISVLPSASERFRSLPAKARTTLLKHGAANKARVCMSTEQKQDFNGVGGATALALIAAAVIPEIAEAAQPGISPSLKNLILSIVAGGVVVLVIAGAVTAVALFDPITRK